MRSLPALTAARRRPRGVSATLGLTVSMILAASAYQAPAGAQGPVAAGLKHDLEKIIEAQESTGWTIDRYEYEAILPDAIQSVCASTPEARDAVLAELDQRIVQLGGPVEEAYRRNGNDLDGLSDLLFATRVRALLVEADRRAATECPFWMPPDPSFRGVQTDAERFVLNVEGGGLFLLQSERGKGVLGGGGSGRLLLGYGIDPTWTVLFGPEFGGAALFKETDSGTQLPFQFTVAVPVVLRRHDLTWHNDLEVAPLTFFTAMDTRVSYGVRIGGLLAISALRIRQIMPWAGVALSFEHYFKNEARTYFSTVKGGLRLGFDWDF